MWFVLKILDLSSLKTRFCEVRFCRTRAGQGFQSHRKKNFARKSGGLQVRPIPSALASKFIFGLGAEHSGFME
jgi:hypothetical protein